MEATTESLEELLQIMQDIEEVKKCQADPNCPIAREFFEKLKRTLLEGLRKEGGV